MGLNEIFSGIAHGLTGILRFSGRDTRVQFGCYAGFIFALTLFIPNPPIGLLELYRELGSADRIAFLARVAATDEEHMFLNFHEMFGMFAMIRQTMLLLVMAAMVRRLHDVGRSGAHALINVLLSLWSLSATMMGTWDFGQSVDTMLQARSIGLWVGMLWFVHSPYLMIQLLRSTDPSFNRGGTPPVTKRQSQIETLRRPGFGRKR